MRVDSITLSNGPSQKQGSVTDTATWHLELFDHSADGSDDIEHSALLKKVHVKTDLFNKARVFF